MKSIRNRKAYVVCDTIFSSVSSPTERFQNFFEYIYETQADLYKRTGHVCGALPVTLRLEMACNDEIRKKSSQIICFYEKYYKTVLDLQLSIDLSHVEFVHAQDDGLQWVAARVNRDGWYIVHADMNASLARDSQWNMQNFAHHSVMHARPRRAVWHSRRNSRGSCGGIFYRGGERAAFR